MDNQMNSNNQNNQGKGYGYYDRPLTPPPKNNFAAASLILGVCSLVLMCTGFSFPIGALGMLFAILSRKRSRMDKTAKAGMTLSTIGFVSSIAMIATSTYIIFSSHTNPATASFLDNTFEQTYGMDFDEFFKSSTGVDFNDLMDSIGF